MSLLLKEFNVFILVQVCEKHTDNYNCLTVTEKPIQDSVAHPVRGFTDLKISCNFMVCNYIHEIVGNKTNLV